MLTKSELINYKGGLIIGKYSALKDLADGILAVLYQERMIEDLHRVQLISSKKLLLQILLHQSADA